MKLFEIAIRTLCDVRAGNTADAVFLFSQTDDNQYSVLSAAHQLLKDQLIKKVLISDSDPKSGYPGYVAWENELCGMGVPKVSILGIDLRGVDSLNTLVEANAMMQHAKQHQYTDIYVTASPFHQLRAFMTSVTAAQKYYPQINLYSYNGTPLPWLDRVVHSQGETQGPRRELIGGELDRIRKYQHKGDLATDADVLSYLDKRDRKKSEDSRSGVARGSQ
jgi:hypothetical protein